MMFKNWSMKRTFGLLIGLLSPIVFIPIILGLQAWLQNFMFAQLWYKFTHSDAVQAKFLSISIISNLIWFYLFLNKEKWELAMGVIVGTIAYLPYIVYLLYFA